MAAVFKLVQVDQLQRATPRREIAAATAKIQNRHRLRIEGYARRSMSFQSLEPRQLLASDISVTDFTANGTNLRVSYDIAAETAPARKGVRTI